MSNTEDNTPIDNELKAYLAGEDGVSAAYRQTGAEEPPAELDRLILAAARSAIKPPAPRKLASLQQKLPIAASFMVGVLITSMYFRQTDDSEVSAENARVSAVVRDRVSIQAVDQPPPAPISVAAPISAAAPIVVAPAAPPPVAADPESQAESLQRVVAQQAEQLTQQAARSAAAVAIQEIPESAVNKTAASQDAALADTASETADAATDARATVRANVNRIATAGEIAPPAVPANFNETRAESDTAGQELEEIMITGSRVRAEDDISYRENQQEWLERILALGTDIVFQINALEENNSRLEEEMELFSEAYPDVDLEAELENLETE